MKKELSKQPLTRTVHSKKGVGEYLKQPYARILIPEEDGQFSAEILEFPGCYAQGESASEAFASLEKAAAAWIKACLDQGQEIPPPSSNQGYSGRMILRMPRGLHRAATRKAHRDGISLNQCLVTAIAAWVGADNLFERIAEKAEMKVEANLFQTKIQIFNVNSFNPYFVTSGGSLAIPTSPVASYNLGNVTLAQPPKSSEKMTIGVPNG